MAGKVQENSNNDNMCDVSDSSVVRTWDFSEANEVQERLDALRAMREAQRAQRKERGSRKAPRFPPQWSSESGSGDEQDTEPCARQDSMGSVDGLRASRSASHARAVHKCPWEEGSQDSGEWRDLEASGGSEQGSGGRYHCHSISLQPGCRGEPREDKASGCDGSTQQLSRSLPATFPGAGSEAACFGRSLPTCAHVPPRVLRLASVSASEAERGRSRMTSWDILRPRSVLDKEQKGSGDGIKVAG